MNYKVLKSIKTDSLGCVIYTEIRVREDGFTQMLITTSMEKPKVKNKKKYT